MVRRRSDGPVNLLSLDGGGLRALSEVVMLHRIMKRVQEIEGLKELPKPCEYFDLIGGTGTGGLVAIMFGKLRMNTEEALSKFSAMGKAVFHPKEDSTGPDGKLGAKALEEFFKSLVKEYGSSEVMYDPDDQSTDPGRTFVCAIPSSNPGKPQRFRTYRTEGDRFRDCKIWEAARATTTATSSYFSCREEAEDHEESTHIVAPNEETTSERDSAADSASTAETSSDWYISDYSEQDTAPEETTRAISTRDNATEEFFDATMDFNNPIAEVLDEAGLVLDSSLMFGCILSLGCGTRVRRIQDLDQPPDGKNVKEAQSGKGWLTPLLVKKGQSKTEEGRSKTKKNEDFSDAIRYISWMDETWMDQKTLARLRAAQLPPRCPGFIEKIISMDKTMIDPEKPHYETESWLDGLEQAYFRFSVPDAAEQVDLSMSSHKSMKKTKEITLAYFATPEVQDQIEKVAQILSKRQTAQATVGHTLPPNSCQVHMSSRLTRLKPAPSRFFTGRYEIIQKMANVWLPESTSVRQSKREYLLCGNAGVGKTQIALKFAQLGKNKFEQVFWIDAANEVTMEQSYHEIARSLDLQATKGSESQTNVLHWMNTSNGKWLLVLDNLPPVYSIETMNSFVPARGNIIYCSRYNPSVHVDGHFGGWEKKFPKECVSYVDDMGEWDAMDLLLKVLRMPNRSRKELWENEGSILLRIALLVKVLGCLPLAIEQAGAFIFTTNCSIHDYTEEFHKRARQVRKDWDSWHRMYQARAEYRGADDIIWEHPQYVVAVSVTLDISMDLVCRQSMRQTRDLENADDYDTALKMLNLLAFFHNEDIAEEMIMRAAEEQAWQEGLRPKETHRNRRRLRNPLEERRALAGVQQELPAPTNSMKYTARQDQREQLNVEALLTCDENGKWNPVRFRRAANILKQLSLLRIDREKSISMDAVVHALVKARTIKGVSWRVWNPRASDNERLLYELCARSIFFESVPRGQTPEEASFRCRLLRHGMSINAPVRPRHTNALLEGRYDESWVALNKDWGRLEDMEKALRFASKAYQMKHPRIAQRRILVLTELAHLCSMDPNRRAESEAFLKEALEIAEIMVFRRVLELPSNGIEGQDDTIPRSIEFMVSAEEAGSSCLAAIQAQRQLADFYHQGEEWIGKLRMLLEIQSLMERAKIQSDDVADLQSVKEEIAEAKNNVLQPEPGKHLPPNEHKRLEKEFDRMQEEVKKRYQHRPMQSDAINLMGLKQASLLLHYHNALYTHGPSSEEAVASLEKLTTHLMTCKDRKNSDLRATADAIKKARSAQYQQLYTDTVQVASTLVEFYNKLPSSNVD